jgi:hypothetical protein
MAKKHYLQVTDEHFAHALRGGDDAQNDAQCSDLEENGANPTQQNVDIPRDIEEMRELVGSSVGDEGLEPPTSTV